MLNGRQAKPRVERPRTAISGPWWRRAARPARRRRLPAAAAEVRRR
jgi:hypothetical protein